MPITATPAARAMLAPLLAAFILASCSDDRGVVTPIGDQLPGGRLALIVERGAAHKLALSDADGRNIAERTDAGRDGHPAWSPDGRQVAFDREPTGGYGASDIYVLDAGTGLVRPLRATPRHEWAPAWSPDGGRIAFTVNATPEDSVYTVLADGTGLTALLEGASPAWAPDGRLAYMARRNGVNGYLHAIYVRALDGSIALASPTDSATYSDPAWSADGRIAAARRKATSGTGAQWSLVVFRPGQAALTILTDTLRIRSPAWAPEGREILFTRAEPGNQGALWIARDDASAIRRLASPAPDETGLVAYTGARWQPAAR